MSYTTIQSILDTKLATVTGLPVLQLENIRYEPKVGVAFVRPTFMPVEALRLTNANDLAQGLYTVDIFYPADKGTATASAMADAVKAMFPRGLALTSSGVTVHITMSYRAMAQTVNQFYQIPVIIRWECDLLKTS